MSPRPPVDALLPTDLEGVMPQLIPVPTGRGTSRGYAGEIRVGKPGRCPERPVLAIVLFDNSASITGGNDPIGQRFLEAGIAIQKVGSRCRCGRDLATIVHFDTPTSGDLDPTPIVKRHREQIEASLAVPPDGGGVSLLGPSLSAARKIADRYRGSHAITLIVLTDYELFDDYLDDLIKFPGDVHAVVMRATPPPQLIAAPSVTVTQVDYGSPPGTVARAVFTALTRTRPRAKPLPVIT